MSYSDWASSSQENSIAEKTVKQQEYVLIIFLNIYTCNPNIITNMKFCMFDTLSG